MLPGEDSQLGALLIDSILSLMVHVKRQVIQRGPDVQSGVSSCSIASSGCELLVIH